MFLLGADVYKTPESSDVQDVLIDDETPESVDWRTEVKSYIHYSHILMVYLE